ncbi:hypothetical protein [Flavobacterium sp. 102]|uniref:hypothetical protein n=1 Tax=Flavobacterium sp. 102 TaxID=2135623 RepID=UPI000EAD001A|nr:hypothetical protein [Flavobacterium sp. 102]RKS03199.1 hypothetical protein C8C84_2942 [Flavobacterium sp. 102]
MSIIKELNESHESLRGFALNLFLIPFWYVSIFLFNNEFFISNDIVIIFAMCFVISISSSGFLTFLLDLINTDENQKDIFFHEMTVSIVLLCSWLSLLIFVIYTLGFLFNIYIYFYWFIIIYFFPLFIFLILYFIFKKNIKK